MRAPLTQPLLSLSRRCYATHSCARDMRGRLEQESRARVRQKQHTWRRDPGARCVRASRASIGDWRAPCLCAAAAGSNIARRRQGAHSRVEGERERSAYIYIAAAAAASCSVAHPGDPRENARWGREGRGRVSAGFDFFSLAPARFVCVCIYIYARGAQSRVYIYIYIYLYGV